MITESAHKIILQDMHESGSTAKNFYSHYLLKDSDGFLFLNYLQALAPTDDYVCCEEILSHKKCIEKNLSENKLNPKVWSKYAWVGHYHNYFCKLHEEYFDAQYLIDIEESKDSIRPLYL